MALIDLKKRLQEMKANRQQPLQTLPGAQTLPEAETLPAPNQATNPVEPQDSLSAWTSYRDAYQGDMSRPQLRNYWINNVWGKTPDASQPGTTPAEPPPSGPIGNPNNPVPPATPPFDTDVQGENGKVMQKFYDLMEGQTKLANQAWYQQQSMLPSLYKELGYNFTTNEDGTYSLTPMTDEERYAGMSELEKQQYDLQKTSAEREMKALKGELDVDPAFERNRAEARNQVIQTMQDQLGPGWETSSPGMEAIREFDAETDALRSSLAHGEMQLADALQSGAFGRTQTGQAQELSQEQMPWQNTMGLIPGASGPQQGLSSLLQMMTGVKNASTMADASGSFCCFIFTENWTKPLNDSVRHLRDKFFPPTSYVSKGYKAMARVLVPGMMKSRLIMALVRFLMLSPLTCVARWAEKKNRFGWVFIPVGLFWCFTWDGIGRVNDILHYSDIQGQGRMVSGKMS